MGFHFRHSDGAMNDECDGGDRSFKMLHVDERQPLNFVQIGLVICRASDDHTDPVEQMRQSIVTIDEQRSIITSGGDESERG